jgi:hypothetical protein
VPSIDVPRPAASFPTRPLGAAVENENLVRQFRVDAGVDKVDGARAPAAVLGEKTESVDPDSHGVNRKVSSVRL